MASEFQWMNDSRLSSIPHEKLLFLQQLYNESKNVSPQERMAYFTNLAKQTKQSPIKFSKEELQLLTSVVRSYK